jgi:hypothetical protein
MKVKLNAESLIGTGFSPAKALNSATGILDRLGIHVVVDSVSDKTTLAQIEELAPLDPQGAAELSDVVRAISAFNDLASNQVRDMRIGERFETVRQNFQSILTDTERLVKKAEAGKQDNRVVRAIRNRFIKIRRGSVSSRYQEIRNLSEQVFADAGDQVKREATILAAYKEFRVSLRQACGVAEEIFIKATAARDEVGPQALESQNKVDGLVDADPRALVQAELERDQAQEALNQANNRVDIAGNLKTNLRMMLGITETVMTRYAQTNEVKDALLRNSATFYTTTSGVLSVLNATTTQILSLNELSSLTTTMAQQTEKTIASMSNLGGIAMENATKAAFQTGVSSETLKKAIDNTIEFRAKQQAMIDEARLKQEKNYIEIRRVVEDGSRRLSEVSTKAVRQQALKAVAGAAAIEVPVAIASVPASENTTTTKPARRRAAAPASEGVSVAAVPPVKARRAAAVSSAPADATPAPARRPKA